MITKQYCSHVTQNYTTANVPQFPNSRSSLSPEFHHFFVIQQTLFPLTDKKKNRSTLRLAAYPTVHKKCLKIKVTKHKARKSFQDVTKYLRKTYLKSHNNFYYQPD